MDPDQFKQLRVVNQLRRLNKAGEEMTWVNLLEYMGMCMSQYLSIEHEDVNIFDIMY